MAWKDDKPRGGREAFSQGDWFANFVVDVGKREGKNTGFTSEWLDAEDLDGYLRKPRSVEKAKKRFQSVFMSNANR